MGDLSALDGEQILESGSQPFRPGFICDRIIQRCRLVFLKPLVPPEDECPILPLDQEFVILCLCMEANVLADLELRASEPDRLRAPLCDLRRQARREEFVFQSVAIPAVGNVPSFLSELGSRGGAGKGEEVSACICCDIFDCTERHYRPSELLHLL